MTNSSTRGTFWQGICNSISPCHSSFLYCTWRANIVPLPTGRSAASKIKFRLQRCVYATQFLHRQVVGPPAPSFGHHLHSACNSVYLPSQFRLFVVGPGPKLLVCCFYGRGEIVTSSFLHSQRAVSLYAVHINFHYRL